MKLSVEFEVEYEQFDLAVFQAGGHFVCGLTDEHGFRRDWQGHEVHVFTLKHLGEQVLRVMADSKPEAERLMRESISGSFLAWWMATQATGFNHSQFTELNERRNQLQAFITSQYAWEVEHGEHQRFKDAFDTAVWYMRKERNRISRRILRWLRREPRPKGTDWMPQEWRG